jgi:CDP-diacylglycerol--glycerol-3-phosphate 3-phosphatidyltransferase
MITIATLLLLLPFAWLLVGLAVYPLLASGGRIAADEELSRRGNSAVLGATIRNAFAWTAGPAERFFVRAGISANALSVAGCVLCAVGGVAIGAGELLFGGLLVLESSLFDYLDGRIARAHGTSNPAGEFLDSTLDRYADAFCFGGAAFLLRANAWNLIAALVALAATAIVPYARAKSASLGRDLKTGTMQRAERVVLLSGAAIFSTPLDWLCPASMQDAHPTLAAMIWFLAISTAWTAIGRTRDGFGGLKGFQARPKPPVLDESDVSH